MKGIIATEEFFRSLGMPTSFQNIISLQNEIDKMLTVFYSEVTIILSRNGSLNRKDVQAIYEMAFDILYLLNIAAADDDYIFAAVFFNYRR